MQTILHKADTRGHADHGWLNAHHSFSFAGWQNPERIHYGALRVLNDDIVAGGEGFGKHPHDNMEIITIVLDGVLAHTDSMGHERTLQPNEVQVMSAGTGVYHSEYNHLPDEAVNLLQLWIFPNKKHVEPRYGQTTFDPAARVNQWQTLVSPIDDPDPASLHIHQDAWIHRTTLQAGQATDYVLHRTGNGVYLFVINGAVRVEDTVLGKRDALGISEAPSFHIVASDDADLLAIEVPMEL